MITLSLVLTDVLTPLLFGYVYIFFFTDLDSTNNLIFMFLLYGMTVVFVSFIRNYYSNYFASNFCDKIRISVKTSVIAVFFQLIGYLYYQLSTNLVITMIWASIPLVILFIRYLIRANFKDLNNIPIHIIGEFYKFNDYEIKMLREKGFFVYFHDSYQNFTKVSDQLQMQRNSIITVNLSKIELAKLGKTQPSLYKLDYMDLEEFMERYLRKLFISPEYKSFNIKTFSKSPYFIKRIFDYFAILIISPFLIIFTLYIFIVKLFLNIKEPLFYRQKRYGINNNLFTLYKFRTMYTGSESEGNTEVNDTRIYSFAKGLRKYRIDEFPQIFNILIGNMHLVGPRAEWFKLSDKYIENITHYGLRHIVKPGITGWAQIIYPYGFDEKDAEQKLMYDLYYIKNWSIWLEIEICFKTLLVILDKKGF